MGANRPLTQKDRILIVSLAKKGLSNKEIAAEAQRATSTVYRVLQDYRKRKFDLDPQVPEPEQKPEQRQRNFHTRDNCRRYTISRY